MCSRFQTMFTAVFVTAQIQQLKLSSSDPLVNHVTSKSSWRFLFKRQNIDSNENRSDYKNGQAFRFGYFSLEIKRF